MPPRSCHDPFVHLRIPILILFVATGSLVGCSTSRQEAPAPAEVVFEKRLNENGAVTFRSWDGKAYRMNSDTELAFFPDHNVQMLDWGLTLTRYGGHYTIDREGRITASFEDYQPQWPMTQLDLDGDTLLLRPVDPDSPLIIGQRHPTMMHTESGFWPFRMLSEDDERKVLAEIHAHASASHP